MPGIQYYSLSALQPIDLNYRYSTTEPLIKQQITYDTGLNAYTLQGTEQFQDIAFNNETCLILTSSVNLSSFFSTKLFENNFFGSVLLKPRNSTIYYVAYNSSLNSLYLSLIGSHIYISPIANTNEVELVVERKYIQVKESYPYEIVLSDKSLDPESIHRQRFICNIQDNLITLKTKTNTGYRYLSINADGVLRATGTVLNEAILNDYIFNVEYIAINTGIHGFVPVNEYLTYYFDFEDGTNNKTLTINKTFTNNPNNFLLSFTFDSITNNTANINIANLKTISTPAGGLATVNNSYDKPAVTTN